MINEKMNTDQLLQLLKKAYHEEEVIRSTIRSTMNMYVTLLGMVISLNDVQPSNTWSPILVTLLGMFILLKVGHAQNAYFPMLVIVLGKTKLEKYAFASTSKCS